MSKVIVVNHVTLDGVMQGPGRPDEDTRDGFIHGGWAAPYGDAVLFEAMGLGNVSGGAMLFGRLTYEDLYHSWANRTDNPYSAVFENAQKYVASTTLTAPLPWVNSALLTGDVTDAVAQIKAQVNGDIVILGSGALIQSLMPHNLIDEYLLPIYPLILGSGHHLFPDGCALTKLKLISAQPTTTGVIIARYQPAESA